MQCNTYVDLIIFFKRPEKGLTYRYLVSTIDELEQKSFLFFASISCNLFTADTMNKMGSLRKMTRHVFFFFFFTFSSVFFGCSSTTTRRSFTVDEVWWVGGDLPCWFVAQRSDTQRRYHTHTHTPRGKRRWFIGRAKSLQKRIRRKMAAGWEPDEMPAPKRTKKSNEIKLPLTKGWFDWPRTRMTRQKQNKRNSVPILAWLVSSMANWEKKLEWNNSVPTRRLGSLIRAENRPIRLLAKKINTADPTENVRT